MTTTSSLEIGLKLRQYRIDKVIGQGGFGITYLATDEDLERKVAIKECYPRDFVDRKGTTVVPTSSDTKNFDWALSKFLIEATTLAKFKHPGIVQVLQIIKDENETAYMVLEFIEGKSFDEWIKSLNAVPSQKQLQSIMAPLLAALEVIHRNNYTHRDIAPDNIYVRQNGQSVLLDFGAARLSLGHHSKTLNLVVKEGYSPPEQYYAEGRNGPWTDIYAFAATIYRSIVGKPPMDAMARIDAVNNDEPDPLVKLVDLKPEGYSLTFLEAIDAGLSPQIKNRPSDVTGWKEQLLAPADGAQPPVEEPATPKVSKQYKARKPSPATDNETPVASHSVVNQKPNTNFRSLLIGVAVFTSLILAVGGGWLFLTQQKEAQDKEDWLVAEAQDTQTSLQAYLDAWPGGKFRPKAIENLLQLSQPWNKTYGSPGMDIGNAISTTSDGGFYIAGASSEFPEQKRQAWLVKLSASGKKLWDQSFGGEGFETFTSVATLPDGGAMAAGYSTSEGRGRTDALIVRTSKTGEIIWERRYGAKGEDIVNGIVTLNNGDFIIGGISDSTGNGGTDGWLFKINGHGDVLWDKTYGNLWDDEIKGITLQPDGSLVAVGNAQVVGADPSKFWVLKLSQDGEVFLDRKYGGAEKDTFIATQARNDGSAVLVGDTLSFGNKSTNVFTTVLSPENKAPPKVFPSKGNDHVSAVSVFENGDFVLGGYRGNGALGSADSWIIKLSRDGKTTIWERVLGGTEWDQVGGIMGLPDGGVAFVGTTSSGDVDESDVWVVRLDKNGNAPNR